MRRRLLISALIVFLFFGNRYIYHLCITRWQPKPVLLKGSSYEAGIVLGGMSWYISRPFRFTNRAADRFVQTSKLYRQGIIKKIVVSAGQLETTGPIEATLIKQELIEAGVQEGDIVAEQKSENTFENAMFTKKIIDSLQLKGPFVLITSALHIPRALRVFKKAGIPVIAYPCDFEKGGIGINVADYFWPDAEPFNKWEFLIKEWLGIIVYKVTGRA